MTSWWDGRITVYDLESDGKDPQEARIITGCVGIILPPARPQVSVWMAQPERDIPEEATGVHGITTDRARTEGMPREEAVRLIASWLASGSSDPQTGAWSRVPIVGHNITYDLTLLDREMRRTRVGRLSTTYEGEPGRVTILLTKGGRAEPFGAFYCLDTMVIDKAVDRYRLGPRDADGNKLGGRNTLAVAAEYYGVPIQGDAHSADADALAAGRLAWVLAKRAAMAHGEGSQGYDASLQADLLRLYADRKDGGKSVARVLSGLATLTLSQLHAWQRRQAAEQAESFREHVMQNQEEYAEKDITPESIQGEWPLIPITTNTTGPGGASRIETVSTVLD